MFSAKLRLTDVTDKDTLEAFVNEVCTSCACQLCCCRPSSDRVAALHCRKAAKVLAPGPQQAGM